MSGLHRYAAFISYSSRDAGFARALHRSLESYVVPRGLRPVRLSDHPRSHNRIFPVFLDRDELASGPLTVAIEQALRDSGALIVVCSPDAARSEWVEREIRAFGTTGPIGRIFAIIARGSPTATAEGARSVECLPAVLRPAARREAGLPALDIVAGDARRGQDGYRNACLKVIAGLIGVTPGKLQQRDRARRRIQAVRRIAAGLGVALAALGGLAAWDAQSTRAQLRARAREMLLRGDSRAAASFAIAGVFPQDALLSGMGDPAADESVREAGLGLRRIALLGEERTAAFCSLEPGGRILTSSRREHRRLWDAATGALVVDLGVGATFGAGVVTSFDGRFIAVDGANDTVDVWDIPRNHKAFTVGGDVMAMTFSPTSDRLLTQSLKDGGVLWDVSAGKPLLRDADLDLSWFSSDGARLASRAFQGHGRLWDARTGAQVADLGEKLFSAVWSPDGAWLVVKRTSGASELWDARLGRPTTFPRASGGISAEAFSDDGHLVLLRKDKSTAIVWDLDRQAPLAEFAAHGVWRFEVAPRFSAIVVVGDDGRAFLWRKDQMVAAPVLLRSTVQQARFVRGGEQLIFVTGEHASVIRTADARPLATLAGVRMVDLDHADRIVTHDTDGAASLWDTSSGTRLSRFADFEKLSMSGDRILLGGRGRPFELRELRTGALLAIVAGEKAAASMDLTTDRLVVQYPDSTVGLFDLAGMAPPTLTGSTLRATVCAINRAAIPLVRRSGEAVAAEFAHALRGRPFHPCDWHGLESAEGWLQAIRYWTVQIGLPWDYQ